MEITLKPGYVVLVKPKYTWNPITWLSLLICLGTKSKLSHAGAIATHRGKLWLFEAVKTGIEKVEISERLKDHYIVIQAPKFNFDKYELSHRAIGEWAWDKQTRCSEYDFLAVFVIQPIFILTGLWIGRKNVGDNRKFYCSEFVAWLHSLNNWWEWSPIKFYKSDKFEIIYEGEFNSLEIQ